MGSNFVRKQQKQLEIVFFLCASGKLISRSLLYFPLTMRRIPRR